MIEVRDLTYSYPMATAPALADVAFDVPAGQAIGLVGAAGSGKSTLLHVLGGFMPGHFRGSIQGTVRIAGAEVGGSPWAARLGMVFQDPANQIAGGCDSVEGEVAFGLEQLAVPRDEMLVRVAAALAEVGIGHLARQDPASLSAGETQRVALAAMLVLEPQVLVLDTPTAHLDAGGAASLPACLRRLRETMGTTLVVAEHRLDWLAELVDRVVVLDGGRLVADGAPGAILTRPDVMRRVGATRYTRAALAARAGGEVRLDVSLPVTLAEAIPFFRQARVTPVDQVGQLPHSEMLEDSRAGRETRPDDSSPHSRDRLPALDFAYSDGSTKSSAWPDCHVRLIRVAFRYPSGVLALAGVDLEIAQGETVAVLGANGAGKTTLVRNLNGLCRPTEGSVQIGDWDTRTRPVSALAARVSVLFQRPEDQLFARTVFDEVAFAPRQRGIRESERSARVAEALEAVGLGGAGEVHPYDLPRARRKLLALAAVLAQNTPIVVLDEPTAGQDALGSALIGRLCDGLAAQGRTVIAVTHDADFAARHFARVVVLAGGRVVADGQAAAVLGEVERLERAGLEPPQLVRLSVQIGVEGRVGRRGESADEARFLEAWRGRR